MLQSGLPVDALHRKARGPGRQSDFFKTRRSGRSPHHCTPEIDRFFHEGRLASRYRTSAGSLPRHRGRSRNTAGSARPSRRDLNDGVRMNIRPFVQAGILRRPPNIKWTKDRGTEPKRPKEEYPAGPVGTMGSAEGPLFQGPGRNAGVRTPGILGKIVPIGRIGLRECKPSG